MNYYFGEGGGMKVKISKIPKRNKPIRFNAF